MKKLRTGIVGLGRLGRIHAANIAYRIPNMTLVAACSLVPEELEYAKAELGVTEVYSDYREMLAKADIEAVVIITPSGEHCWQIAAALDAGKHVFCEKPLGVDMDQCWGSCGGTISPTPTPRRRSTQARSARPIW